MEKRLLGYLFGLMVLFGCESEEGVHNPDAKPPVTGTQLELASNPPIVTQISATNAPISFPSPAPRIVQTKTSFGFGKPSITRYTVSEGLPTSILDAPEFDSHGNLWLGSFNGLIKFDGHSFFTFDENNGMQGFIVDDIFVDSNHRIWMSTEVGISAYDQRSFSNFPLGSEYHYDSRILTDLSGNIWMSSSKGLFQQVGDHFEEVKMSPGLTEVRIRGIARDKSGKIIISTDSGLFYSDNKKDFYPYSIPDSDVIGGSFLFSDSQGGLYFDQGDWISRFDGAKTTGIFQKIPGMERPVFHEDGQGHIWIGWSDPNSPLIKYDGKKTQRFELWEEDSRYYVTGITHDSYGNIWVTSSGGLIKLSFDFPAKFEGYPDYEFLRDIVKSSTGELWGTDNSSLIKFEEDQLKFYDKGVHFPAQNFGGAFADRKGNIWFSAIGAGNEDYKLIRFDGNTFTAFGEAQGIKSTYLGEKFQDAQGIYWFMASDGLYRFDGKEFSFFGKEQGLPELNFTSVFQDSKGMLWFGSSGNGLFRYDGESIVNFTKEDGLLDRFVQSITEDHLGNIWIAMDRGVNKFDGETFTSYGKSSGLNQVVLSAVNDSINRQLLFGTLNGLGALSYDQIERDSIQLKIFNYSTGFDFSFINLHGIALDNQGNAYLAGSNDGKISFSKFSKLEIPKPSISEIRLDSKPVAWNLLSENQNQRDSLIIRNEVAMRLGQDLSQAEINSYQKNYKGISYDSLISPGFLPANLEIPFGKRSITFDFSPNSPAFGGASMYQYLLEGHDENWSEPSEVSFATFGNISEGDYRLRVKTLNPFGESQSTVYSFAVLPPWYRTWWAFLGYFLGLLALIKLIVVLRDKKLLEENRLLEAKVAARTDALNQSLDDLKSTQTQLVQSEKMASMGELASGIAHEIQNPLNFVNNFTEVSDEMIEEVLAEQGKPLENRDDQLVEEILRDVKSNLQKIRKHGLQADAIVKNMLEHSKQGHRNRELTDLNALANGFIRISYHSFRSKHKNSGGEEQEIELEVIPAENLPKVMVVSQEMGKVFLNLLNNSFYAVRERALKERAKGGEYIPKVQVKTELVGNGSSRKVKISVQDNGVGIPESIKGKVFQPFFTTKPTGQGTGLGLSLTYDIVKSHNGEIWVETVEGEGTTFQVLIPVK